MNHEGTTPDGPDACARKLGAMFRAARLRYHLRPEVRGERPLSQRRAAKLVDGWTRARIVRLEATPQHAVLQQGVQEYAAKLGLSWGRVLQTAGALGPLRLASKGEP